MKQHKQNKRKEMRESAKSRREAVSRFKQNHPNVSFYSDHLFVSPMHWADIVYLHPTRHMVISVDLTTCAMAYRDKCEEEADKRTEHLRPTRGYEDFLDNFEPIYAKRKGSKRPKVKYYRMLSDPPDVVAQRVAHMSAQKKVLGDVANEKSFSVCEEMEVTRRPYGIFVSISLALEDIKEEHIQLALDKILGLVPLDKTPRQYSKDELDTFFGQKAEPEDVNPLFLENTDA
jgi:hypothetical protein